MMSFDALEKERKSKSKAVDLVQQARAERELRNQDKKSLSIQQWWKSRCLGRAKERRDAAATTRQQISLVQRLIQAKGGDFVVPGSATAKLARSAIVAGASLDAPVASGVLGLLLASLKVFGDEDGAISRQSTLLDSMGAGGVIIDCLGACCSLLVTMRWQQPLLGKMFRTQTFSAGGLNAIIFSCKIIRQAASLRAGESSDCRLTITQIHAGLFGILDAPASVVRVLRSVPSVDEDRAWASSSASSSKELGAKFAGRRKEVVAVVSSALEALVALRALAVSFPDLINSDQASASVSIRGPASGAGQNATGAADTRRHWASMDFPLSILTMPCLAETVQTGLRDTILTKSLLSASLARIYRCKSNDELERLCTVCSLDGLADKVPLRRQRWAASKLRIKGRYLPEVDSRRVQPWRHWPGSCFLLANLQSILAGRGQMVARSTELLPAALALACSSASLVAVKWKDSGIAPATSGGMTAAAAAAATYTTRASHPVDPEATDSARGRCTPTMLSLLLRAIRVAVTHVPDCCWQQSDPVLLLQSGVTTRSVEMPAMLKRSMSGVLASAWVSLAKHAALEMQPSKLKDLQLRLGVDDNTQIDDRTGEERPPMGTGSSAVGGGVLSRVGNFFQNCFGFGPTAEPPATKASIASRTAGGPLSDTTSIARSAAASGAGGSGGKDTGQGPQPETRKTAFNSYNVMSLCALLATMADRAEKNGHYSHMDSRPVLGKAALLECVAFGGRTPAARLLWYFVEDVVPDLEEFARHHGYRCLAIPDGITAVLHVFCIALTGVLQVVDSDELHHLTSPVPLSKPRLRRAIELLKSIVGRAHGCNVRHRTLLGFTTDESQIALLPASPYWPTLERAISQALRVAFERHVMRPLCPADTWLISGAKESLLQSFPFALPFEARAGRFAGACADARASFRDGRAVGVEIRRVEGGGVDVAHAFSQLSRLPDAAWKRKLSVRFVNEFGMAEAGIDAGGLAKDLWTSLSGTLFDPNYGLFRTTDTGLLYPNPASQLVIGPEHLQYFRFVGVLLAKALYEGIVVQPRFAHFLLAQLMSKPVLVEHLESLDKEFYKRLVQIKQMDPEVVESLCLTFTTPADEMAGHSGAAGGASEVSLVAGGAEIEVSGENVYRYVAAVADYRMRRQIREQVDSFREGFSVLMHPRLLQIFSEPELQAMISGPEGDLDIDDLSANSRYLGGYSGLSGPIRMLWQVLREASDEDKRKFLRFVTACERAPPLGFGGLEPRFGIQPASGGNERLPTASTCFNTLKLPAYTSKAVLKSKLMEAIRSGAGFDLS